MVQADPAGDMVDIFGRDEFDRSPGWFERFRTAVGDVLDHLSLSWLGPVGQFVLWLLLVVAVVALGAWLWRRIQARRRRRTDRRDDVVPIALDATTDPDELRAARGVSEHERDYKQAILLRYRELVVMLMRQRLVSAAPGRTTGELRLDLADSAPPAFESFDAASDIFEVAWFSDHPSSSAEFGRLDRLADDTLRLAAPAAAAPAVRG